MIEWDNKKSSLWSDQENKAETVATSSTLQIGVI